MGGGQKEKGTGGVPKTLLFEVPDFGVVGQEKTSPIDPTVISKNREEGKVGEKRERRRPREGRGLQSLPGRGSKRENHRKNENSPCCGVPLGATGEVIEKQQQGGRGKKKDCLRSANFIAPGEPRKKRKKQNRGGL